MLFFHTLFKYSILVYSVFYQKVFIYIYTYKELKIYVPYITKRTKKKRRLKNIRTYLNKKNEKSGNTVMNNVKISPKMKNKSWSSTEKHITKWRKTCHNNYAKHDFCNNIVHRIRHIWLYLKIIYSFFQSNTNKILESFFVKEIILLAKHLKSI